jgi:superfamily II DNA/RNA helicase
LSENLTDSATFDVLGLSSNVLKAVADAGYQKPTPIQAQAIPYVLMGRDILGSAQTGTGKTASFTLPMIDILAQGRARARMPRSLILTPTRELAAQIAENFQIYGKYNKLTMALLIGGESFGPQVEKLDRGVDVLIATPGRLIDHYERGRILLTDVKILVIDEADRMLDMGFIPDVERIVGFLPRIRQTLFFSATFPPEVKRLADKFLMNPKEITVSRMSSAAETVEHSFFRCSGHDAEKRAAFRALLDSEDVKNALVFCNRKRDVDILAKSLRKHGYSAAPLHGDMAQSARTETLEAFKAGKITYLVATDVAGRGLDIQGMSHVFNFDVPFHAEDYVHRIGRTGRAGAKGRAITLATPDDGKFVAAIERLLGKTIPVTTIEGFVAPQATDGDDVRSDRSRGRGRSRKSREPGGRSERSRNDRPAATAEPAADENAGAAQPREPVAAREHDDSDQKSRRSGGRDSRSRGKPRRERQDDSREEDKIVAFGDHIPAFLSREVRIRND